VDLPQSYISARRRLAKRDVHLDWRELARRQPPMWPGTLWLYRAAEAQRETRRLGVEGLFVIGTNNAGVLFAFDARRRVVILDEIEREPSVVLAKDFDRFVRAFIMDGKEIEALSKSDRDYGLRYRWKKLVECLREPHPIVRSMNTWSLLVDIANAHLIEGRSGELQAQWKIFRRQHPSRTGTLDKKLRTYVSRWGKS